tara:strand:- start:718 stop:1317 length:600 start_codon:yes stop_codon:yes gene_type:complete
MTDAVNITIEHGKELKAWEQQEQESSLLYTYFKTYLDLGPQRSLQEAQRTLLADDQIKQTPNLNTLRQYNTDFRWQFRAELWDRFQLATESRLKAEQRREEMRIGLEEYQRFQHQMGKSLSSLAAKVLSKTQGAIDRSVDAEWDLDKATRFMSILNQTATTASSLWSDSLGVEKLNQALAEMDANISQESAQAASTETA